MKLTAKLLDRAHREIQWHSRAGMQPYTTAYWVARGFIEQSDVDASAEAVRAGAVQL